MIEATESREKILLDQLVTGNNWTIGRPRPVALTLEGDASNRADLAVGFAVAAQLLGRMPGTVQSLRLVGSGEVPETLARLFGRAQRLDDLCTAMVRGVGRVAITSTPNPDEVTIGLGTLGSGLCIDANGWTALVNQSGGMYRNGGEVGATAAACLVVNELFHLVHLTEHQARSYQWSTWETRVGGPAGPDVPLPRMALGEVDLAGAGAVAQSALWTAAACGLTMNVFCADDDIVDSTNLERLPFCLERDIGAYKVKTIEDGLRDGRIEFVGRPDRFEATHPRADRPLLFAVDDDDSRAAIQQLAPPLAISATTGTLALTIEWSDLNPQFACIACGHPRTPRPSSEEIARRLGIPTSELAGPLTRQRVRAIEERHGLAENSLGGYVGRAACDQLDEIARKTLGIDAPTGSVGFLSWLAGVLLLVEAIALVRFGQTDRKRRRVVPLIRPERLSERDPRPRRDCTCQSEFFRGFYDARRRSYLRLGQSI